MTTSTSRVSVGIRAELSFSGANLSGTRLKCRDNVMHHFTSDHMEKKTEAGLEGLCIRKI